MHLLLEYLGNPQEKLRFIHVAGTNGKGSVCAYISSVMTKAGYTCGRFTSPFIERFEERIAIDGEPIGIDNLTRITVSVKDAADAVEERTHEHPTEFELMCAVALVHFFESGCDICVMEVGLGGRLDATNVIVPLVSVITPIGYDHCSILGNTLGQIAREKAGIVKPGVPVVTLSQPPDAMQAIKDACVEKGSALYVVDEGDIKDRGLQRDGGVRAFSYACRIFETQMLAPYQVCNAALAIETCILCRSVLCVPDRAIRSGIREAFWPGRFEILGVGPLVIVDGAHNPHGACALRSSIEEFLGMRPGLTEGLGSAYPSSSKVLFVIGMLADKDCAAVLETLASLADGFVLYTPDNPRAMEAEELAAIVREALDSNIGMRVADGSDVFIECAENAHKAMETALEKAGPEDAVIAFGTLYAISDIKRAYTALSGCGA